MEIQCGYVYKVQSASNNVNNTSKQPRIQIEFVVIETC